MRGKHCKMFSVENIFRENDFSKNIFRRKSFYVEVNGARRLDCRKQTRQGATHCCRRPRPAPPIQTAKVQPSTRALGPTKPPNRTMTSPIFDLPKIPTHSPLTPARDLKAKAKSSRIEARCRNLQTCTQIELRSKPSTTARAPITHHLRSVTADSLNALVGDLNAPADPRTRGLLFAV